MSSTLSRVVTDPIVVAGDPGTPDVPAQAPYTTTEYVKDPHWEVVPGSNPVTLKYVYWRAVLVEHEGTPAIEGTPGTPDREITQPQAGWSATAFSQESILQGRLVFRVTAPTPGVTVGLTRAPRSPLFNEPTGGYATAEGPLPGLYFEGNYVWLATERQASPPGEAITSFFKEDVFTIERKKGRLRYLLNGYLMRDVPDFYPASDRMWASASLYDAGAQVVDAKFLPLTPDEGMRLTLAPVEINAGDTTEVYLDRPLPRLRMYAGDVAPTAEDGGTAPAPANYLDAALPRLTMRAGDVERGDGAALTLAAVVLTALNGLPAPTPATRDGAAMRLRPITLSARATGVSTPPPNPEPDPAPPVLLTFADQVELDVAFATSAPGTAVLLVMEIEVDVALTAVGGTSTELLASDIEAEVVFFAVDTSVVLLPFDVEADFALDAVGSDTDVWAVNVASSGSTRYTHFPFNSFARIGAKYFGAGLLGVCELTGDTDAGAQIDAVMDLGDKDFGTMQKKTPVEAWLTMAGTRPLVMQLRAEGRVFTYRTEDAGAHLKAQRVKFGKGSALQTTFINPVLRNEGGADFQIDAIEFHVQPLSRKN